MVVFDLDVIVDDEWVRENYNVIDLIGENWDFYDFFFGFGYGGFFWWDKLVKGSFVCWWLM